MMNNIPAGFSSILLRQSKTAKKLCCPVNLKEYSGRCDESKASFSNNKPCESDRLRLFPRVGETNADVPTPKPRHRRTKALTLQGIQEDNLSTTTVSTSPGTASSSVGFPSRSSFLGLNQLRQGVRGISTLYICNRRLHSESAAALDPSLQEEQPSLIYQGTNSTMPHNIYCHGTLLAAVQTAKLFVDCKHFVDMPLKQNAESTLRNWNELVSKAENGVIEPATLLAFVLEHFEQPGGELEDHEPTDFAHDVASFASINDPAYRQWAQELHRKWPTLCRKVSEKVLSDPTKYSLIPVPNPFVVPGGRFREMYYWDSFFTIKGLLASQMFSTVRQMIENMGWLIENFGYVPNGNRIYYLNRSQPPLLTWCVDAYFKATGDLEFVGRAMKWLEREMVFFTANRKIQKADWSTHLYRYHVVAAGPRPESYREDVECAEHIEGAPGKLRLWGDIMAAAESGRDFSARWFHNVGPEAGKMGSTRTSSILPVDLNSIICGNLNTFSKFYTLLGMPEEAKNAYVQYQLMREAIHQVFWNEELGCWFDYDLDSNIHVSTYFDTNFFPLAAGVVHDGFNSEKLTAYLKAAGVLDFPGGVPTSMISSGQQWDFPNSWAPTTWVIIEGLRNNNMQDLAKAIAQKWIRKNYTMWANTGGRMFEKYNVASRCFKSGGGGGEYELQEGFGWTNGVVLDLLLTYAQELSTDSCEIAQYDCTCCIPHMETFTTLTAPQDTFVHCVIPDPVIVSCPIPQEA